MLVNQMRLKVVQSKDLGIISGLYWLRLCSGSSRNLPEPPKQDFTESGFPLVDLLKSFAPKKNRVPRLHKYNPLSITQEQLSDLKDNTKRNYEIFNQRFIEERHKILGCDLAAAHFIVYRGGKVKFHNDEKWVEKKKDEEICTDLPCSYVSGLYLECIDASNTKLRYEGLINLTNLNKLRWLSLRNCPYVDDWFLDKISGEYAETLEYLDISDCFNVTENGLNGFYRFKNLKKLVVHNIVCTISFEFRCFLLEDTIPELTIEGVKYLDVK